MLLNLGGRVYQRIGKYLRGTWLATSNGNYPGRYWRVVIAGFSWPKTQAIQILRTTRGDDNTHNTLVREQAVHQ